MGEDQYSGCRVPLSMCKSYFNFPSARIYVTGRLFVIEGQYDYREGEVYAGVKQGQEDF